MSRFEAAHVSEDSIVCVCGREEEREETEREERKRGEERREGNERVRNEKRGRKEEKELCVFTKLLRKGVR